MRKNACGFLELHWAVLLFGFAGLFGKLLALSPQLIVFARTSIAAVALGLIVRHKERSLNITGIKDAGVKMLQGALLALHWMTFFHSIQVSTVAVGLLSFSTFPIFVTFMEPCFFRERLLLKDVLLAFSAFSGLALVVPRFDWGSHVMQGACWGVVSGLTFAVLSLLNRSHVRKDSPLRVACFQNAFAALCLLPFVICRPEFLTGRDILLLGLLGIFCTAAAHTLFIQSLLSVKARTASVVACLEPVYGIVFALILLGEVPTWRMLVGGSILVCSSIIAGLRSITT